MRKLAKLFCLGILLSMAGAAAAQSTLVFRDKFTDGVRDKAKWYKPAWSDAVFKENGGVLRMYSHPTNTSLFQMAGLNTYFTRKYTGGDTLNLTCKVRVPHRVPSDATNSAYEVGLGVFASMTKADYVELTVRDSNSNRQFGVYYMSESESDYNYVTYPAPDSLTNFFLRMSYSKKTDMINFFWAPSKTNDWIKIRPGMKRGDLFGPAKPLLIQPYAIGYTENLLVPASWDVWLDNYTATYVDQPL